MIRRGFCDEDLLDCLHVDPARIGTEWVGYDRAIAAWRELTRSCSFHAAVIESDPPIEGHRIVAFGASVFVTRAFAEEEIAHPQPGLNSRIIASIDCGRPVVLNEAQLREANTEGGLDLVVLCPQRRAVLSTAQTAEARTLLATAFLHDHLGYRLNRLLTEIIGEEERTSYAEASGVWQFVSEFREFYAAHPDTHWSNCRSLAVMTAHEAFRVPGHIVTMLFQYREPVLRLRESDQRLLNAALTGLTDEDLAHNLDLGLPAVKRRWRSLFERASSHADLFPEMGDELEDSRRGRQKRQFILAYLREHPEELRPFDYRSSRRHGGEG